jgi:hypothetical protein
VLSVALTLEALLQPPLPALLLSGVAGCAAYVLALERMGVVSTRLLLGRVRPPSTLIKEVSP